MKKYLFLIAFLIFSFSLPHFSQAISCINPYYCGPDGSCHKDLANDYPCDCSTGYRAECISQGTEECSGQYCSLGEMCTCTPSAVYGCTNPAAPNYNPSATVDDGSCQCVPHACDAPAPGCGPGEPRTTTGSDGCGNTCTLSISCGPYPYPTPSYGYEYQTPVYGYQYEYQYQTPGYPYPTPAYNYQYQYEYQYQTPAPAFNYTLSNSGNSSVMKQGGDAYTQNTITKTLTAGTSQSVTLTLSGAPSGVSYSISNAACNPTCQSVITFTVTPSAPVGTHSITVTGSPLNKTTSFSLIINANPISVTCAAFPSPATLGELVTWSASINGGAPPYTYSWSGPGISTNPAPSTNPFSLVYSTVGQKNATLTVTDANSIQSNCAAGTLQINFNPNFEEF